MADIKAFLEKVIETTKSIASFVQTVAEWIRERNWVNLISLLLTVIIIGWLSREGISNFVKDSQWFVWG